MKITKIYNTVYAFATQRNATQRNAYHNYILKNNFKFYIFQFFRAVNFLSVSFLSFIKESKSSCSFFIEKKNQKTTTFFVKKVDKKTTPFRIHNSVFMGLLQFIENLFAIFNYAFSCASNFEIISRNENYAFNYNKYFYRNGNNQSLSLRGFAKNRSNPNLVKFDFYNLISLINKFYTKWIATPSLRSARNDKFNYIHAFSCALKNQFEIISRNGNYAFDCNKYFCRNGNNRKNGLFSRNDYGGKFIFSFWDNLNFGFLFNRKILKTKI